MSIDPQPQDLLRELLGALGEYSGARPETPEAIWDEAIRKVRLLGDARFNREVRRMLKGDANVE